MRTLSLALGSLLFLAASAQADPLHEAVDAYALYQNDVSNLLGVDIESGRTVDAALARILRHNAAEVARGWIAYSALTAAQSPQFAAGVQSQIRDLGRDGVLAALDDDIGYARRQNSTEAIALVLEAASADAARAGRAGDRYESFAREESHVQLVASVLEVDIGAARLSPQMLERLHIGPLAGAPMRNPADFGGRGFWDALAGRNDRTETARPGPERGVYAPVTNHILTLAALAVADASDDDRVAALLNEPITRQCLEMQRLELRQCLSVSVDAGERAYCLGHHGLSGPGECFSAIGHASSLSR